MTPHEREARAELTILTTFNLKRAENALSLAESEVALGRDGYTMARAWAQQAGIYTLDMRANVGPLADRLAALRQRIKRTIEHIYPSKQSLTLPASSGILQEP